MRGLVYLALVIGVPLWMVGTIINSINTSEQRRAYSDRESYRMYTDTACSRNPGGETCYRMTRN